MAGNATITLFDGSKDVTFEIWIQAISTGSQNEFMSQQVRDKMSWIPIRRSQMFVNFSIAWPLVSSLGSNVTPDVGFEDVDPADGFAKMNKLQDTIWLHQQSIINGTASGAPMHLDYYNNSDESSSIFNTLISTKPLTPLKYSGWIQSVEKQYIRFQNMYVTNYQMNVLTTNSSQTESTTIVNPVTYSPSSTDQTYYGSGWIQISTLGKIANGIKGSPS